MKVGCRVPSVRAASVVIETSLHGISDYRLLAAYSCSSKIKVTPGMLMKIQEGEERNQESGGLVLQIRMMEPRSGDGEMTLSKSEIRA